jgi:hypothetical protein
VPGRGVWGVSPVSISKGVTDICFTYLIYVLKRQGNNIKEMDNIAVREFQKLIFSFLKIISEAINYFIFAGYTNYN